MLFVKFVRAAASSSSSSPSSPIAVAKSSNIIATTTSSPPAADFGCIVEDLEVTKAPVASEVAAVAAHAADVGLQVVNAAFPDLSSKSAAYHPCLNFLHAGFVELIKCREVR